MPLSIIFFPYHRTGEGAIGGLIAILFWVCFFIFVFLKNFRFAKKKYASLNEKYGAKTMFCATFTDSTSDYFCKNGHHDAYLLITDNYLISVFFDPIRNKPMADINLSLSCITGWTKLEQNRHYRIYFIENDNEVYFDFYGHLGWEYPAFNRYAKRKGGDFIKYIKSNYPEREESKPTSITIK